MVSAGSNWRYLNSKYDMEEGSATTSWNVQCENKSDSVRNYMKIKHCVSEGITSVVF